MTDWIKPDPDDIEKPECNWGYTIPQLERIMGIHLDDFNRWMRGQTGAICTGQKYNHDTKEYEVACGGVSHGMVVYSWDVGRYLNNLPVID